MTSYRHWFYVPDQQQRNIVRLVRSLCKLLYRAQYPLLDSVERAVGVPCQGVDQPLRLKQIAVFVFGFGHSISQQQQRIVRLKLGPCGSESGLCNESNREGAFFIQFTHYTATQQQMRLQRPGQATAIFTML